MSETKPYEKVAAFTKSPGVAQIASYVVFVLEVVLFYAVILPNLESSSQIALGILFSLTLLLLVISGSICSVVDPSDQAMVLYRNDREKFQAFRSEYDGRLLFCDYCVSYVKQKSRHCRVCDRCVQNFDHHCMWINNCVGGMNYTSFFVMILSAFGHLLIFVIALAILTTQKTFSQFLGGFIVGWISGSVNSVFVFLLFNLIVLHIYLQCKGVTTYEFIIAQREQERLQKQAEEHKKLGGQSQKIVYPQRQNHKRQDHSDISLAQRRKKRQSVGEEDRVEGEQQLTKAVRIRSVSSSQSGSEAKEVAIFGEKDITHKSQHQSQSQHERMESGESDEGSIKVSQLFTRNKSLKLIIGNNSYYKPHPRAPAQRPKDKPKAYSMMT